MKKLNEINFSLLCFIFAIFIGSTAEAASIKFNLTDSDPSAFGSGNFGTVTVSQDLTNSNSIDISLVLNEPYRIHQTVGSQHPAFAFNLSGTPEVTITSLTAGFSLITDGSRASPYGTFPYAIACLDRSVCAPGYSTSNPISLSFVVTPVVGALSLESVISNGRAFFTADIQYPSGTTGNVASLLPAPVISVPEPNSFSILFLGLLAAGLMRRQKLS